MLHQIKNNSVVFCDVADDLVVLHQIHGLALRPVTSVPMMETSHAPGTVVQAEPIESFRCDAVGPRTESMHAARCNICSICQIIGLKGRLKPFGPWRLWLTFIRFKMGFTMFYVLFSRLACRINVSYIWACTSPCLTGWQIFFKAKMPGFWDPSNRDMNWLPKSGYAMFCVGLPGEQS